MPPFTDFENREIDEETMKKERTTLICETVNFLL